MSERVDQYQKMIRKADKSFNGLQMLASYIRGFKAAGGKDQFGIPDLDEVIEFAALAVFDSKLRYQRELEMPRPVDETQILEQKSEY